MSRTIRALACLCLCAPPSIVSAQTRDRRVGQPPPVAVQTPPAQEKQGDKREAPREEVGEDEVVRVETTLVMIPVSITDRDGRYIPDLRKEDFRIFEDGDEQQVAFFAAVEKPFTVVLMLDTSASIWSKLGRIRDAATAFVAQLRPDDQVMVISFARGTTVHCEPTTDRKKIISAIKGVGRGMSTHLYDALETVMTKRVKPITGRKAIVLFTDGVDASSHKATYESTAQIAEELDAIIYPIRYDTYDPDKDNGGSPAPTTSRRRLPSILRRIPLPLPGGVTIGGGGSGGSNGSSRGDYARGERYLHDLADLTGGRFYEASRDLRDLDRAFSHIAEELRRQYSLGYYPRQPGRTGERRRVRVRVNRPDLAVRSRDSYIYQTTPGAPATAKDKTEEPEAAPVLKKPFVAAAGKRP
ncbi:MAG TPA: VWA domain-containing protein [Pyrinomonadaceae bacterium]|nr:VWA domain-containing protein [Pyrinomonadaceae bacterium]